MRKKKYMKQISTQSRKLMMQFAKTAHVVEKYAVDFVLNNEQDEEIS